MFQRRHTREFAEIVSRWSDGRGGGRATSIPCLAKPKAASARRGVERVQELTRDGTRKPCVDQQVTARWWMSSAWLRVRLLSHGHTPSRIRASRRCSVCWSHLGRPNSLTMPLRRRDEQDRSGSKPGVRCWNRAATDPARSGPDGDRASPNSDIRLHDDFVSRTHAALRIQDSGVWIEDLDSSGGTFVNSERIKQSRQIRHGDRITLGAMDLWLVGGETASEPSFPIPSSDTTSTANPRA